MNKPSLASVLGAVGHFLIGAGLLTLAFAAFQLWGTGIAEARAQNDLTSDFEAQLEAVAETRPEEPEDLTDGLVPLPSNELPATGSPIAVMEIESLGIKKTIVEGITRDVLRDGPGRYPDTAFPGQPGNSAIAGHRTTYGAPFFNLDKIEPGELIKVTTLQGEFFYEVDTHTETGQELGYFIVEPTRLDVLANRGDEDTLTLTACHPKYSAAQRLIVTATLTSAPAPETDFIEREPDPSKELFGATEEELAEAEQAEEDALTASLNWQPDEFPGAAVFGAITLIYIYGIAWISKQWKRKTTIGLAAAPFLILLFFFFTRLERMLPAV